MRLERLADSSTPASEIFFEFGGLSELFEAQWLAQILDRGFRSAWTTLWVNRTIVDANGSVEER